MLRQMSSIFGSQFWDYLTIGVSFWTYKPGGNDENHFMNEVNTKLQEVFHLERNFSFVFTDSWSQTNNNPNDPVQQQHWQEETGKLWAIATEEKDPMEFKNIDDIMEENAALKEEVRWLNDVITNNISELRSITDALSTKQIEISSNVTRNTQDIQTIEGEVDKLAEFPVGTIIAWINRPSATENDFSSLPSGWQRCDGSTITQGIWKGRLTPDLNIARRFLRGGPDHSMLTMEEDQMQDHHHSISDPGHTHPYVDKYPNSNGGDDGYWGPDGRDRDEDRFDKSHSATTSSKHTGITVKGVTSSYRHGSETRPKNMNVIYIIRID